MIFAREINGALTGLVKKVDAATAKHSDCEMGSFIVFLNDDEGLETKLKRLAKKEGLKKVVLTIETNAAGPERYKINKDAEVTVVLYKNKTVRATYAFKKGELKPGDVDRILKDLPKILPSKD